MYPYHHHVYIYHRYDSDMELNRAGYNRAEILKTWNNRLTKKAYGEARIIGDNHTEFCRKTLLKNKITIQEGVPVSTTIQLVPIMITKKWDAPASLYQNSENTQEQYHK